LIKSGVRGIKFRARAHEHSKSILVGPLLEKLAQTLPKQLRQVGAEYVPFFMKMPDAPLTVLTVVVEHADGQLVPMVNV
jgi:hypothetical protein